ncbi:hypothetical protein [Bacillus cereus]|uniref:hypothetical protein n=1 Tax=Bacillus cereus TaxID=1396 RepID=UPI000BF8A6C2|nr:hypothetical protein [Bacillus cereus]PFA82735.1 hypothetical protein CN393_30715 [Bacillus cereus]
MYKDGEFLSAPKPEGYLPHLGALIFIVSVVLFFVCAKQKEWKKCINCFSGALVGVALFFTNEISSFIALN